LHPDVRFDATAPMFVSLRNLLWPKQQRMQPTVSTASMGSLAHLPEDVLTARVACYFPSREEYLSLRLTSKVLLGLTQRAIASKSSRCSDFDAALYIRSRPCGTEVI
jgi:hypothetical protein